MSSVSIENEYGTCNCCKLDSTLPWRAEYLYLDTPAHRADKLFIRAHLPVRFLKTEYGKGDSEYVVVFCHFPRKREEDFLRCMADLEKALIIEGHSDYREVCDNFIGMIKQLG